MSLCATCGTPLAPDARFCSKCATPVATPGPLQPTPPVAPAVGATVPAAQARRSTWWIVPLVIVVLIVIAWLVVAGLPFGDEKRVVTTSTTETIAEGTTGAQLEPTGTVVELGGTAEPPFATTTAPPPQSTSTQIVTQTQPPPTIVEEPTVTQDAIPAPPRPIPRPAPVQTAPGREPPQAETRAEISEAEATSILRNHLAAANPYGGVSADCLQLRSVGYRNVGYTYSMWDACVEGGGTRMLGRWRVDAKTREVFRQRDDGRYLRP